jgi:hypothetical protein
MGYDLDGSQIFPNILSLCIASLLYAFIGALFATGYPRLGKLMLVFI